MPIYEYRCDACGAMREMILKPGETARPTCTGCRKRMRRVISPTSFVLKGSGWYVTDYPSDARKKGLDAEKAPAPPAAGEAAAKKEAVAAEKKPAPAKESRGAAKAATKRK
jgi:putative FmdB family regulatory protein